MSGVKSILLTRGHSVKVDRDVFAKLHELSWQAVRIKGYVYAAHAWRDGAGERSAVHKTYLHRLVARAAPGQSVRFRNGDTLDCRRENLRLVG